MVTVFSTPNCVQCKMTYKRLDAKGLLYEVKDVTQDEPARQYVMEELGYSQAPVVVVGDMHWSGFRPDLIDSL